MKTRFALLISVLTLVSINAPAAGPVPVTRQQASQVAEFQLSWSGRQTNYSIVSCREIIKYGLILAYAFDLYPAGYVVISASTGLRPVIAYSFESNFGELESANPLFEIIAADLPRRFEFAVVPGNSVSAANEASWASMLSDHYSPESNPLFEQWPATGDGWLKTNWTQNPPYNDFCPMDPVTGQRSYAGCPATAMAQILNFHNTINDTRFNDSDDYYHNYAGRQYWIDDDWEYADFPSFPVLNAYLDTLATHYLDNSILTNQDKAAITFACGVAATQVYTSQGSGTFGVDQAYEAYQRFGFAESELLVPPTIDLFARLSQNIKDTMPAHLAIVDQNWSTGHNVVVDGYNTDDYYHLNFGWGGSYNGWYLLPEELPYNLTVIEGVVVDIKKQTVTGTGAEAGSSLESHIYPNPVKDFASLEYEINRKGSLTFSLFDCTGAEIMNQELPADIPGRHSHILELKDLPPGVYFYSITSGKSRASGKIIRSEQ
jgi:hypothetical protein